MSPLGPISYRALLLAAGASLLTSAPSLAQQLPTGGSVAHGGVSIGAAQNGAMTIRQSTDRGIVNWQSFSVGQGGTVNFQQPSASAATLNRVTGQTASSIAGRVSANGQVYLVNPNGIHITATGTVNAAGFIASTLDIHDRDFSEGRNSFSGSGSSATVRNDGRIRVRGGGDAVLIGGRVENNGSISAPGGRVGLAAGEQVSVDVEGDGFLSVAVPSNDANRTRALINQTGRIRANGGRVEMRAATSADLARAAINLTGTVEAGSVSQSQGGVRFGAAPAPATPAAKAGRIAIDGGAGGRVKLSGKASVKSASGRGGEITVTGREIGLTGAQIDASGASGGGAVKIGGDYQGGSLPRAATLAADAATRISADATEAGQGGRVILWSDEQTDFAGTISARGGIAGGDGGFAEVSGKLLLNYTGFADLRAPLGETGNLLLDPYNITIANGAGNISNSGGSFTANGPGSVVGVGTLQAALAGANVTVTTGAAGSAGSEAGLITVQDAITWNSSSTLTLQAAGGININAPIYAPSGGLTLSAGGSITATSASITLGRFILTSGNWVQNNVSLPTFSTQDFQISGGSFLRMAGGQGITGNPYVVADVYGLQGIGSSATLRAAQYRLGSDLSAAGTSLWNGGAGFMPIGGSGSEFSGFLNGQNRTISGLTINRPNMDYVGLFGTIQGGTITNLNLTSSNVTGRDYTGGLIGLVTNGTVSNTNLAGTIRGRTYVGGLFGYSAAGNSSATASFSNTSTNAAVTGTSYVGGLGGVHLALRPLANSHADGSVRGDETVGGLVGYSGGNAAVTIRDSYATASVTGYAELGGLVGRNDAGTISQSYATGTVTGVASSGGATDSKNIGGLVGWNVFSGIVSDSYATGNVSGIAYIGGLVGTNYGDINTSFARGNASGLNNVGGLVGWNAPAPSGSTGLGRISKSYATGAVSTSGTDNGVAGGLVGYNEGTISQSYATGSVTGGLDIGGFVGHNTSGTISQSYAAGAVSGTTNVGGFAGSSGNPDAFHDVYWDIGSTGRDNAVGGGVASDSTGLSSAQMKDGAGYATNFAGFDFGSTWAPAGNGYRPELYGVSGVIRADAQNATMVYGDQAPTLSASYLGTGYWNTVTSNTWSAIAGPTSNVGTYAITGGVVAGFTAGGSSRVIYGNNTLSVMARPITITPDSASRIYGNANPTLSYAIGGRGLVNGDSISGVAIGAPAVGANVGNYGLVPSSAVFGSGLASNYQITYQSLFNGFTITPRPITITADAKSRVYGDANPALTYAIGGLGLVNGDSLSGVLATEASPASNVGSYGITQGSLAASGNYAVTYIGANLSVTARPITITADAQSRVYGDANPTLTYLIGDRGMANGDSLSGALTTGAGLTSGIGDYAITLGSLAASSNYSITYQGTMLTVTPRAITVTADNKSRVYGDANPALTYRITAGSLFGSDTLTSAVTTNANATSNVGSYAIERGTLATSANYAISYMTGALSVTRRLLSVTADAQNRVYGDANPALTYSVSGLANGDMVSAVGLTTPASTTSNVGTYAITAAGAVFGLGSASNYAITYTSNLLTVTPRPVTVTPDAVARAYGDANPGTGSATSNGLVNGNQVTGVTLLSPATAGSPVGGYDLSIGSFSFSGDTANYSFTLATRPAGLTVTPRALTVTANAQSRAYGDANPALTYTVGGAGLVNGDTLAGELTTDATLASNVGRYDIGRGSIAASANYALSYVGGSLDVTQRPLTVTADVQARAYGNDNPSLTYTIGGRGLVNGDSLSGALTTSADARSNVGFYGITQGTLAASGNYALSYASASLEVRQRAITVTAHDQSRAYGDANPALTYTIGGGGLVNGDTLTGGLATSVAAASNVGSYGITQGTLAASGNYALSYSGASLAVTQRALTITADTRSRTYGDANPALTYTIGGAGLVNGDSLTGALATGADTSSGVGSYPIQQGTLAASGNYALTYQGANLNIEHRPLLITADVQSRIYGDANPALTYTVGGRGLVNGDTLTGALATDAGTTSNIGAYAITQGTLAVSANYTLGYQGADLTVTPRPLTVSATTQSRTYGEANPALTYTIGGRGLVNGDTLAGALATAADARSDVGAYAIQRGSLAASGNYDVTYQGADLTVTPRTLTISANAVSRAYGEANPALTYALGGAGLVNGDALASVALAAAADARSDVGSYEVTAVGALFGAGRASNYSISYQSAELSVRPRPLTVTAEAQSRVYGEANPALTYAIGGMGLANGDTLSGALTTDATAASDVGSYGIRQGSLTASANYAVTYEGANLTVTPRALTIAANAQSRVYGEANPAPTYTIGGMGLVNGDTLSGALATDATAASNLGLYGIRQGSLAASANYAVSYQGANLAVTPRAVTVSANAQNRAYGEANPALTNAIGGMGLVNGDTLSGALATDATAASNVGLYAIKQGSLAASANYAMIYQGADLIVTPRLILVAADDKSRRVSEAEPALTYRLITGNLVNGDSFTGSLVRGTGQEPGRYPVLLGSLTAGGNYQLAFQPGTFEIRLNAAEVATWTDVTPAPRSTDTAVLTGLYTPTPPSAPPVAALPLFLGGDPTMVTGSIGTEAAPAQQQAQASQGLCHIGKTGTVTCTAMP